MSCESKSVCRTLLPMMAGLAIIAAVARGGTAAGADNTYGDLLAVFRDLRDLERPSTPDGVPDYTAARMEKSRADLAAIRDRFTVIDTSGWSLEKKIDFVLVRAEMNGLDFDLRVLQPWARDPAYYAVVWPEQSDTPSHEGPVCHGAIELWTYAFPLSSEDASELAARLITIPPLLGQARTNLTGNARDLWIAGIRSIRRQATILEELAGTSASAGPEFLDVVERARAATLKFADWLDQQAAGKTGPSGVGKENYTWFLRNVLMVPLSWEEEAGLLKRELSRAYASLELERQHNRRLPPIVPVSGAEEYAERADRSVTKLMQFLREKEILQVRPYMEPELRKHLGEFVPEAKRNFFRKIMHLDPTVLYTHGTHWFDTARMNFEPHPSVVRREPLPYNIWMSRSEGLATAVEEMFMHAGLYDDSPRSRELVWLMLAQRCARGIASLYVHANEMSLEQAREYHITWTPDGWTGDVGLVVGEQHLYLRQPGYGTSYVTGKYLIERLIMDRSRQLGDRFRFRDFFADVYSAGLIPVSLIRWELTGMGEETRGLTGGD